jgi:hypothetical protein
VVNEYVLQALETMPPSGMMRAHERIVAVIIKNLMDSGLINHHFNKTRGIDEFRATLRLAQRWKRDFREVAEIVSPTETIVVEIGEDCGTFIDRLLAADIRHTSRKN